MEKMNRKRISNTTFALQLLLAGSIDVFQAFLVKIGGLLVWTMVFPILAWLAGGIVSIAGIIAFYFWYHSLNVSYSIGEGNDKYLFKRVAVFGSTTFFELFASFIPAWMLFVILNRQFANAEDKEYNKSVNTTLKQSQGRLKRDSARFNAGKRNNRSMSRLARRAVPASFST